MGDLAAFRALILDRILRWSAAVSVVPCVAGVALAVDAGLWAVAATDAVCWSGLAAAAYARHWPYAVRAGVLLGAFGAVGIGILAAVGPFGVGLLWLLGLPASAAVLFGVRGLWVTEGVVLGAIGAVWLAARAGLLWWTSLGVPALWWVMASFSVVGVSLVVGLISTALLTALERSLDRVAAERAQLASEIEVRREAEQQRAKLQQQLVVAQKMELVGQLAGGVAHDLNNVLTVVRVEGGFARAAVPDGSEAAESIDSLLVASASAAALCTKLLLVARRRPGERSPIAIDAHLESLAPLLRGLVGEGSALHLAPAAPGVRVIAEAVEIEQVITNLVANARDALPAGGTVRVATREVVDDRGAQVCLEVADTGVGMAPETLERVFEPFFTTKAEGTGLGLATVYGLVRSLDGTVLADSTPGEGTTFRVYLPVAEAASDPTRPTVADLPTMRLTDQPRTVLVVDDNPLVRPAIGRLLEHLGCRVVTAGSVAEALAVLDGQEEAPDLVLTDVQMAGGTGVDLAEALRARRPSLPILAMSGWLADGELAVRLGRLGVPLLRKPFAPEALARAVAEALATRVATSA